MSKDNYFERIQKLQQRVANAKAEERVAKIELEKIEKELEIKGIKPENLYAHITESEANIENLKNTLEKRLKEAENEINSVAE